MKEIKMDIDMLSKELLSINSFMQEENEVQRESQDNVKQSINQIKKDLNISKKDNKGEDGGERNQEALIAVLEKLEKRIKKIESPEKKKWIKPFLSK